MIKTLTKHGNSLALVIDKPILDLLEIDASTRLSITTTGHHLLITPVRASGREKKLRAAIEEVNKRYGKALKRLAD